MPKLSHAKITKGQAIAALINLYRDDKEFACELDEIRDPYLDLIVEYAMASFDSGSDIKPSKRKNWKARIKASAVESTKELWLKLIPYCGALKELAFKWKIRARWAAPMLLLYDVFDVLRFKGLIPLKTDIPLELYEHLFVDNLESPIPPLEIKVPSWAFILEGREKVVDLIRIKLQDYEKRLKANGLKEHPSSLHKHAQWWFEHYVHHKTYKQIGEEHQEYYINPESIKRAVYRFSKILGFKIIKKSSILQT